MKKYDFVCIDEDGEGIRIEAETYADAIRKFFAGETYAVVKSRKGYKVVWGDHGVYKIEREGRVA